MMETIKGPLVPIPYMHRHGSFTAISAQNGSITVGNCPFEGKGEQFVFRKTVCNLTLRNRQIELFQTTSRTDQKQRA